MKVDGIEIHVTERELDDVARLSADVVRLARGAPADEAALHRALVGLYVRGMRHGSRVAYEIVAEVATAEAAGASLAFRETWRRVAAMVRRMATARDGANPSGN